MKSRGVKAVLMNSNGNVRKEPNANTVSELLVLNPIAREIPDQARPKNAIVRSMSNMPNIPVTGLAPSRKAKTIIMVDCINTRKASLVNLPSNMAYLLTGVTNIFWR